jgi:exopolysaccharide production protein ExoQ
MSVDAFQNMSGGRPRALRRRAAGSLVVRWRTVEWWGAGMCLFLQTGAGFPLLMAGDGDLTDPAKAKLRLLSVPAYAFIGLILGRNIQQLGIALKRNFLFHLLVAMPFVSVLWSVSPSITLRRAIGLLFSLLLAYLLAIRFTPRQLLLLVMATLGACIVPSLALLAISPRLALMPLDGAMRGIFLAKNSLGWYSSILTLVTVVVLLDGSFGLRRTAMVLLAASLACLAGSMSMTSVVATASMVCLIWFYTTLPKARGIGRVVFVLVFVQAAIVLLILLHEFLVPVLEALGKDATLTGRVPLWELVDTKISSHLLLGFGYQAFWTEANPEAWAIWSTIQWMAPHAHNGFRDILLSFGIGGMALFVLVVVPAIRRGAVLQCRAPEDGWLWLNVFVIMVLVMNLTESIFLVQNDAIFVLFAAGIIMFSLYSPVYTGKLGYPPVTSSIRRHPG